MGKSVLKDANDIKKRILAALCIGRSSNVYAMNAGADGIRTFHFEESPEQHPEGFVTGEVWEHLPSGRCGLFDQVVISGEGIESAPLVWFQAAEGQTPDLVVLPD